MLFLLEGNLLERLSLMDPWTATSQLPFPWSHGNTSQMTAGSVPAVFTMCVGGNYTFFIFSFASAMESVVSW